MKIFKILLFPALFLSILGCDLGKQLSKIKGLAECEYKLDNLSDIELNGVNMSNKTSLSQIGTADLAKLANGYLSGNLPLAMNVNMAVKNTSTSPAGFTAIQYIIALDGQEITKGSVNNNFTVGGNSTSTLPIRMSTNLKSALSGKSQQALINLVLTMAGQSTSPTIVGLRIKPSFLIGGQRFDWPSYFDVKTNFTKPKS